MKIINLPTDTLGLIHQWIPFEAGLLYPFPQENKSPDGRIEALLAKGNFLTQDGKLSEDAKHVFSVIADSQRTAKLRFLVEGDLLDYQVFFSKDNQKSVSLKRGQQGFTLNAPSPSGEIIDLIADFSGMGNFGTIPAKWLLSNVESIVLSAIIDLLRRRIMLSLAKDDENFEAKIASAKVKEVVNKEQLNANWLIWAVRSFVPEEISVAGDDVDSALAGLAEKNLIKVEGSDIVPEGLVVFTARKLLHLNCLYLVDTFNLRGKEAPEKARFSVIQNGVRELLLLDTDGKSIAWQGISGKALISLLCQNIELIGFESQVKNVSAPQKVTKQSAPAKAVQTDCPSCGKPLKKNAKFCSKCGKTL